MIRLMSGFAFIFILLSLWCLIKTYTMKIQGFGLVYSNFEDMPLGEPSQTPEISDINDIDAQGILDAAQGIRNSVIPNAPWPPSVGQISSMPDNTKPVDEKANYEELRNKLRDLERKLPNSVKEQIANLTPAIVNGMLQARNREYAQ
jgi:hypothetical protein